MEKLSDIQSGSCPTGPQILGYLFSCLIFPIPCIVWCNNKYQNATKQWLKEFNEVLEPLGMYARTQRVNWDIDEGDDGSHVWLSLALDADEVAKLKREPHLWEYTDDNAMKMAADANKEKCGCSKEVV